MLGSGERLLKKEKLLQRHPVINKLVSQASQVEENCKSNSHRQFQLRWSWLLRESVVDSKQTKKENKKQTAYWRSAFCWLLLLDLNQRHPD